MTVSMGAPLDSFTDQHTLYIVLVYKAFRYRVYPTLAQVARLTMWEDALRFLWNLANEQRLLGLARPRCERRYPTAFDQINELTDLRAELPWLADVPRDVCAALLVELDKAWQICFKKLGRAPRFKRKGRDSLNFCEPHPKGWRLGAEGRLRFPKLGPMSVVLHRPLEGTPKTCTLTRDGDQWFSSIMCAVDVVEPTPRIDPVVAIDRGITHLLADSDGRLVDNPRCLQRSLGRLARAQRAVARKKKGSKNRDKAKLRVMRLHRTVRRQRAHVLHELSAAYAKSHGTVVVEKLNVAGMMRGRCARGIADAGWSTFASMLRYKIARTGGRLIEVPAAYSSQTCAVCGVVDAASRKGVRFDCTACGHHDHADLNAAKILKHRVNRSVKPAEGTVPETTRRSRKRVTLRVPRRALESSGLGRG